MTQDASPVSAREQLIWALHKNAQQRGHFLDREQLADAARHAGGACDSWADMGRVLQRLQMPAPVLYREPDALQLPQMAWAEGVGWCIVMQAASSDRWKVLHSGGTSTVEPESIKDNVAEIQFDAQGPQHGATPANALPGFRAEIRQHLKRHRSVFLEVIMGSLVLSLIALALSLYSMQVYDRVIPTHGISTLTVLAVGVGIALAFEYAMKLARARLMDAVVVDVDSNLSRFIFQRLLSIRIDQMPASVGSLASQLRSYEQVRSFYTSSTLFVFVDLPMGLVFIGLMFLIAGPLLPAIPLCITVLLVLVGLLYRRKFFNLSMEGVAMSNMKTGLLVETVEGAETIKAGAGHWKFLQRWQRISASAIRSDLEMRHNNEGLNYITAVLTQISYVGVVSAGAYLAIQGQLSTGALVACSILGGRVIAPLGALPGLLVQHAQAKAAITGIERICKLETDTSGVDRMLLPETLDGRYTLTDVRFSYGGQKDAPLALAVPQLYIGAGERVGVMGPVGSGKSTLLRLLTGMYRPQSGRVLLDGLDLSHINRQVITDQVGYLQQDTRLFQGSLRENLLIGAPDTGDQAIFEALKRSMLIHMVASHPRGLDMPIFEGGRGLSGGQRQLVALTRLLITHPRIWLLDEPTASMDHELERHCLSLLAQELADPQRTLVCVTHKTSMLALVNRLIVVVGNRIILDGPRDDVLQRLQTGSQPNSTLTKAPAAPASQPPTGNPSPEPEVLA
ncbi:MAG: ATP-binding cassette domain-containing protein [Betaproteobacteria bacterium]|jgi:ATP-binding cassette subfamily C protein LapB